LCSFVGQLGLTKLAPTALPQLEVQKRSEVVNVQRHHLVDEDSLTGIAGAISQRQMALEAEVFPADGAEDVEVYLAAGLSTAATDSATQVETCSCKENFAGEVYNRRNLRFRLP
jgi:hypothetical protein